MKNLNKITRLFDEAERSRQTVSPNAKGIRCPICWNEFSREKIFDKLLSIDDVPQQSWGALWEVITCKTCNNKFGSDFQGRISGLKDIENLKAGASQKGHKAKIVTNIGEFNATVFTDGNRKLWMKGSKKINNPEVSKFWQELGTQKNVVISSVKILLKQPYEPEFLPLVLLRDSYLLAFHFLGYPYLCRADLQDIRTILHERKPVPEGAMLTLPFDSFTEDRSNGKFCWVQAPEKLAGFLVRWIVPELGVRFIVLPFFPHPWNTFQELCNAWAQASRDQEKIELIIAPVEFAPSARFSFRLNTSEKAGGVVLLTGELTEESN